MISIEKVHYLVKESLNKINTNYYQDVPSNAIDENLNIAQLQFIRDRLNYKEGKGFEVDSSITKDLSSLVIRESGITPVQIQSNLWQINLHDNATGGYLNNNCYLFQTGYANAIKNSCEKTISIFLREHDDKLYIRNMAQQKPSFLWNRLIAYIEKSSVDNFHALLLDTDNDFDIDTVTLTYIKYPRRVCLGGYYDIDNTLLTQTEFEFQDEAILAIKDIAVSLISDKLELPTYQQKVAIEQQTKQ